MGSTAPQERLLLTRETAGRNLLTGGGWPLPHRPGTLVGKVLLGTVGSWKHVDGVGGREEDGEEWGQLGCTNGGIPWHGPSLLNGSKCFWGDLGSPLAGLTEPSLAVGPLG